MKYYYKKEGVEFVVYKLCNNVEVKKHTFYSARDAINACVSLNNPQHCVRSQCFH